MMKISYFKSGSLYIKENLKHLKS